MLIAEAPDDVGRRTHEDNAVASAQLGEGWILGDEAPSHPGRVGTARPERPLELGVVAVGALPGDRHGLVGLPVWLWTDQNELTWGPIPVSKTDGGITVNVEADAQYVVWDMGDGHVVRCDNPGTSFSGGATDSPTCGYRYLAPSRNEPGGVYTVTATTHWLVTWTANTGDGGTLSTDVPETTTIMIDELEVVTS